MAAQWNMRDRVFILVTAAMFLPFYLAGPIFFLALIYLAWQHASPSSFCYALRELGWWGIFILYAALVSLLDQHLIGLAASLVMLVYALAFQYYQSYLSGRLWLQLLQVVLWGSLAMTAWSLVVYLHYISTHGYDVWYIFKYTAVQTRAEATFFNANYYGLFCVFALAVALYLLSLERPPLSKVWAYLALLANTVSIILTASRWLLPTTLVVVLWLVLFIKRDWWWRVASLVLVLVGILILKPDLMPRLLNLTHAFEDRFDLWWVGWQLFLYKPLTGAGPFSYMKNFYLFTDKPDMHAHQLYIDTLLNYGVIGCLIILRATWPFVMQLAHLVKRTDLCREAGLVTAMVVAVLVHGLMDVSTLWIQTGYFFLMVVAAPTRVLEEAHQLTSHSYS